MRKRKELRQNEVAVACGIDPSYLAGMEGGRRGAPKRELVEKLVAALALDAREAGELRRLAYVSSLERHFRVFGPSDWSDSLNEIVLDVTSLPTQKLSALRVFLEALNGTLKSEEEQMDP